MSFSSVTARTGNSVTLFGVTRRFHNTTKLVGRKLKFWTEKEVKGNRK